MKAIGSSHSSRLTPGPRIVIVLLAILGTLLVPGVASGHAFLERSDPEANAVLPEAPTEVRLWFTEPVETEYSRAELYDAEGNLVSGSESRIGEDNQLILPLPSDLPNGTYSVQWRNISTVDGHPQQGYLPFTVGSQADVVTPETPEPYDFSAPPGWLDAVARWLGLLGIIGAVGGLIGWFFVLRFARDPLDDDTQDRVQGRTSLLVLASIGVAFIGSLLALVLQAWSTGSGIGPSTLIDVLVDTRYGHLWLARVVLLLALAAAATTERIWDDPPGMGVIVAISALCGALLLPFSLVSHAAALEVGDTAAIATDWLHLAASSVWIGGLLALLVALVYGVRGAPAQGRREAFAIAIGRFSTLAIASVIILSLTGFYSAWLQVGNLIALRETSYGQTLLVKLLLLVPLLILGVVNQRYLGPRMLTAARSGAHFGRTIAAEVMLGIGILFTVGLLTGLPTARETITSDSQRSTFHLDEGSVHAVLYVSPGAAGYNDYIADLGIDGETVNEDITMLLRIERAGDQQGIEGVREVPLEYAFANRFEAAGAELSVVGEWDLELIVRREGAADTRFPISADIPRTPPAERIPGEPPYFDGLTAGIAVILLGLAVVAVVIALRSGDVWRDRVIGSGMGAALAVAGALILFITSAEPTPTALAANPVPATEESIASGRETFLANCAVCHGQEGLGDGPQAATLAPPPANLTEPHVTAHTDGDLFWWVQNGINPAMPGFGDELSEDEIWDVINYVRSLRSEGTAER